LRLRGLGVAIAFTSVLAALATEVRVKHAARPLTDDWKFRAIEPRGATRLGISFRPPQIDALGLNGRRTLRTLLGYPFQLVRLGAYWNRVEPAPGVFDPRELDLQVEAAETAGKQIVLCVGALKTFGYPEFFAPAHHLPHPLPEGTRIRPATYAALSSAARDFIGRVVERYKVCKSIIAWQVEHEAVDPLGMEHSWRLDVEFVAGEVLAVRQSDPTRPILMNGFLPVSLPVSLTQWWQTRDQGDSLTVAQRLADIVGVDYYPRHALLNVGGATVYLDATRSPWQNQRLMRLLGWARARGRRVMISEGQAEPWEAVTTPPSLRDGVMFSCQPEDVIDNYNRCLRWARRAAVALDAYIFWGAEYWVVRDQHGDSSYLEAFVRILEQS
jgi:Beta-galactosidase